MTRETPQLGKLDKKDKLTNLAKWKKLIKIFTSFLLECSSYLFGDFIDHTYSTSQPLKVDIGAVVVIIIFNTRMVL